MLHPQIREEIRDALRAKETLRLEVLRGILTAFVNELVILRRKPDEILEDDKSIAVLKRLVKQRKDASEQFEKGGRPELAKKELDEIVFIEKYLPAMMGRDEIAKIAKAKIAELGKPDKNAAGKLIGAVMKETKGAADGNDVKELVMELLS